jgi:hypothetical protein
MAFKIRAFFIFSCPTIAVKGKTTRLKVDFWAMRNSSSKNFKLGR